MRISNIILLIEFFILIPLTIYFGDMLSGRLYYLTATVILLELSVPFIMAFGGRRPKTGEIIVILVMCALAIIGRVAVPIPHFKPTYAIIMLTAVAFGPEAGFMTGGVSAMFSNFFYGQGAYMPWQMLGYGAGGMLVGFIFLKHKGIPKPYWLMLCGFSVVVLWIGPLLDTAHLFVMMPDTTVASALSSLRSGLLVNISQGLCSALIMLIFGRAILEKLQRVKSKYAMTEGEYGI